MKIAIIGARGIPACYGGFDTFVEELSVGLQKSSDIDITVFCRSNYYKDKPKYYKNIRLIYIPAIRIGALESLLHSFMSSIYVFFTPIDILYYVDEGNAPFSLMMRLLGKKVILHTDGLGWKRKKWGNIAKLYYKIAAWLAAKSSHILITDNPALKTYYKQKFHANSYYIAYGSESPYGFDDSVLSEYNLEFNKYLVVVSRLVQENNVDIIIKEFVKSSSTIPLVIVGDNPYNKDYVNYLKSLADDRVIFTGSVYDQAKLNSLYKHAFMYLHGHEVGGTNPSLLRAMGNATTPLVLDVPYNKTVVDKAGYSFSKRNNDLSEKINALLNKPDEVEKVSKETYKRSKKEFTWQSIVDKHIKLLSIFE